MENTETSKGTIANQEISGIPKVGVGVGDWVGVVEADGEGKTVGVGVGDWVGVVEADGEGKTVGVGVGVTKSGA